MRAPRVERHRPQGLPLRTMLCGLCKRGDVAEVDVALALGRGISGVSAETRRRHRTAHLWAWLLDIGNAGRARDVVARIAADLGEHREASLVTIEALAALARIDEYLYPAHAALVEQRQRELARDSLEAARRLVEYGTVDGYAAPEARKAAHLAAARVAARLDRVPQGASTLTERIAS